MNNINKEKYLEYIVEETKANQNKKIYRISLFTTISLSFLSKQPTNMRAHGATTHESDAPNWEVFKTVVISNKATPK